MNKLWHLSQIKLFESLSTEEVQYMHDFTTMTTYSKGAIIQYPQAPLEGLYFVKTGKLRLYTLHESGKEYTIGILRKGNSFGSTGLFDLGTKNAFIATIEESLVCHFENRQLEEFLSKRPQLMLAIIETLGKKIVEQQEMLQELAFYDLRHRTLFWLKKLSIEFGVEEGEYLVIDLPLSHQDLANMVGATREGVSSTLSTLSKQGLILSRRKQIGLHRSLLD